MYSLSCTPQGYRQLKAFIATQAPLPSTVDDLWQMVWEQESRSLVALTTTQEMAEQVRVEGRGGEGNTTCKGWGCISWGKFVC